jgi:hypothetical protein
VLLLPQLGRRPRLFGLHELDDVEAVPLETDATIGQEFLQRGPKDVPPSRVTDNDSDGLLPVATELDAPGGPLRLAAQVHVEALGLERHEEVVGRVASKDAHVPFVLPTQAEHQVTSDCVVDTSRQQRRPVSLEGAFL